MRISLLLIIAFAAGCSMSHGMDPLAPDDHQSVGDELPPDGDSDRQGASSSLADAPPLPAKLDAGTIERSQIARVLGWGPATFLRLVKSEAHLTAGKFIGGAFFIMLIFAALTSSISLLEVVVSAFVDKLGWTRKKAAVGMGGVITLVGVPSAFSLNFLGAVDQVVGQMLLIVGGLFTAIFVGYKILPQADAELALGLENETLRKGWAVLVRYVIPVILVLVLYLSIPTVWAAVAVLF